MASTASPSRPRSPESLDATVALGGQEFRFRLFTRPLTLGRGTRAQYYWMDSAGFRISRGRRAVDPANYRNCVGHWWSAMQSEGLGRDPVQRRHLLLATSFALFSRDNGPQRVYRDAHLACGATEPTARSLPKDVSRRLREVARSRDRHLVRAELESLLGGPAVPAAERAPMEILLDGILRHGEGLIAEQGGEGLYQFLGKLDAWVAKRRKKGGQDWRRRFLDFFAYECKASFYRCYSNTWVDLVPWLRRHRGLDEVSERFLRFWHMQGQAIERPGGEVVPDVFHDQVLSLHPLSGFFMKDPALCAIAGEFFGSDDYDRVMTEGRAEGCGAYWGLVGAVLTAAHLYRQASDEQAQRRGVREYRSDAPEQAQVAEEGRSLAGILEEYLAARGARCAQCRGALRLRQFHPAAEDATSFEADVRCGACNRQSTVTISRDDLVSFLGPQA
jgi:hypothetical protein